MIHSQKQCHDILESLEDILINPTLHLLNLINIEINSLKYKPNYYNEKHISYIPEVLNKKESSYILKKHCKTNHLVFLENFIQYIYNRSIAIDLFSYYSSEFVAEYIWIKM
jgi:hypothetical protein